MADVQTTTTTLELVAEYADGDTRTITQENPNTSIDLAARIKSLSNFCKTSQVIIGDKTGAAFKRFKTARTRERTITKLDIY